LRESPGSGQNNKDLRSQIADLTAMKSAV
jgi:hypothetical protein